MKKHLSLITTLSALIVLFVYLSIALGGISFSGIPNLIMAISIGIFAISGAVEIHKELSVKHNSTALTLGTLFLIIGFAFFILMIIVQQAVFIAIGDGAKSNLNAVISTSDILLSRGLNYIQLGMDVTFDVFYSLGLIFVSSVMIKVTGYTRLIGVYGIIAGVLLAGFNLATFPLPPSQSGLFDVGPFTVIWWLSIIALGHFESRKQREAKEDT